jgi:hypothetical protein
VPDWRDAAAYAPLLDADHSILAWEWLRRDRSYADAALDSIEAGRARDGRTPGPGRWGLHAFEHPHVGAPQARPIWRAERHPAVLLTLAVGPAPPEDALDLDRLAPLTRLLRTPDGYEHVLLTDGVRAVRLDVLAGTLGQGPVRLRYLLGGFAAAERPLLTLRRLAALQRTGRFSKGLHRAAPRARRWVLMLRAWDALQAGADQRQVAEMLLSATAGEPRWRSRAPSLRSRAQRLVRGARRMAAGCYRELLQ